MEESSQGDQAPESIILESPHERITGTYAKVEGEWPSYQRRSGGDGKPAWLFRNPKSQRWFVGPRKACSAEFHYWLASDDEGSSPDKLQWPDGMGKVTAGSEALDQEKDSESQNAKVKANLPKKLAVMKKMSALIPGGYIKDESLTHDSYPVYKRDSSADKTDGHEVFIFHESGFSGGPKWYFGASIPQPGQPVSLYLASENDAPGPHMAHWLCEKLDEVVDADHFNPPENLEGAGLFQDSSHFPHDDTSLGKLGLKEAVKWIPARYLGHSDSSMKVFDHVSPTDLLQGKLGDCWLIAAMSCFAEYPNRVKELFQEVDQQKGTYKIKLYDSKQSSWQEIELDEFIPSEEMHWWDTVGKPLFARPNGDEMWALLLEKAFAKMMGTYAALQGGNPGFAFRAMTGEETVITWRKKEGQWDPWKLSKGGAMGLERDGTETAIGDEEFFQELKKSDSSSFLMSAGMAVAEGHAMEHKRDDGLIEGHAYAILQVADENGGEDDDGQEKLRLVKLRNPWGNDKEWKGKWSDDDPNWSKYPKLKETLKAKKAEDGMFWMDWQDFTSVWDQVIICHKDVRTGGGDHASQSGLLQLRSYGRKPRVRSGARVALTSIVERRVVA
eukprot:TRINITY_DN1589_c0_g3_i1.p1 TRINITY_DN1589_c0_g3~~TRINITY_DN1589_c0_g3_i1.p1  ORF type:complete len:684 (+),score=87.40 TRINITY_DN1589_c0_g3_i1:214-2052(+)